MGGIAVTGFGAVSALGPDSAALLRGIITAQNGVGELARFEPGEGVRFLAAEVTELPGSAEQGSPTHRLAIAAAEEAAQMAGLLSIDPDSAQQRIASDRVAVVVGTTTGGIAESEAWYLALLRQKASLALAERLRFHSASTVGEAVSVVVEAAGPCITVSTACSSGANAILIGQDLLESGQVDVVLAGGTDALSKVSTLGFSSLKLISQGRCTPFGANRDGLNLGEAGAFLVLEREDYARQRGGEIHAFLAGSACSCDAYHMTAPDPETTAVVAAIGEALADADVAADEVDYINAHGTGTPANDQVELVALERAFPAGVPAFSSTKSFLGHTLGAAGAIEAVVSIFALREGILPATVSTGDPDAQAPASLVVGGPRPAQVRNVLSTSYAFGGNNTALLFSDRPRRGRVRRAEWGARLVVSGAGLVAPRVSVSTTGQRRVGPLEPPARFSAAQLRRTSPLGLLAIEAMEQAWAAARLAPAVDVGLVFGTALADLSMTERFLGGLARRGPKLVSPQDFQRSVHNAVAGELAILYGLRGFNLTVSQGLTSGETAFQQAILAVRSGRCRHCICVAADLISDGLVDGIAALRDHLGEPLLGEGAAALVVERACDARARDVESLTELEDVDLATPRNTRAVVDSRLGQHGVADLLHRVLALSWRKTL